LHLLLPGGAVLDEAHSAHSEVYHGDDTGRSWGGIAKRIPPFLSEASAQYASAIAPYKLRGLICPTSEIGSHFYEHHIDNAALLRAKSTARKIEIREAVQR
jgi:hypothetical protein